MKTGKKMNLNEKVKELLIIKDLQPSKLADLLEVPRSTISHILSGRNKPSLDVVKKLLETFPDVNPDWLLFDDEQLYKDESDKEPKVVKSEMKKVIDELVGKKIVKKSNGESSEKKIEKIIIFYEDKSFDVYNI